MGCDEDEPDCIPDQPLPSRLSAVSHRRARGHWNAAEACCDDPDRRIAEEPDGAAACSLAAGQRGGRIAEGQAEGPREAEAEAGIAVRAACAAARGPLEPDAADRRGRRGAQRMGEGEITIAYTKFFPYPTPDLSTMRPGTEGDVILSAVIDEQGKISQLTLLTGIDPAINQNVIQTVSQWTFTPATKDGQPVASKQELHFHFRSARDG